MDAPAPASETSPRRVLIFGGGGVFGHRLVDGILATTDWHVIVTGRDPDRLAALRFASDRITTLVLDARTASAADLRATGAWAVVDAAGPFQGASYTLVRAAIAARLPYVDLADARDFVAGFTALDADARAAGVVALTGASSTPALSNAVLDRLTTGWRAVDTVDIVIAPGNRAPRGRSVIRSILSYAGQHVRVFHDGTWQNRFGWGMTKRVTLQGLRPRFASVVETPDLDIVVNRFAVREAVTFRAGMELSVLQLGLLVATLPVRIGLLRSLVPFAGLFHCVAVWLERFGSDRGGMRVDAAGVDARGRAVRASWWLMAEAGAGPTVPTLPALAALRALAVGPPIDPGARPCVGVLNLADITAEFERRGVSSGWSEEASPPALFPSILGTAFDHLPPAIRALHQPGFGHRVRGTAIVDGADTWLARVVARLFGLPPASDAVDVSVRISPHKSGERWVRNFGGRVFSTTLSASDRPGGVVESFGPLHFELDLRVDAMGVAAMAVRSWRIACIPLPSMLAPASIASERVDAAGRFLFDLELRLPLALGRLVRYRGSLKPDNGA